MTSQPQELQEPFARAVLDAADVAGVGIFVTRSTPEARLLVLASAGGRALLGYGGDELSAEGLDACFDAPALQRLQMRRRGEHSASAPLVFDTELRRKGGTKIPARVVATTLWDAHPADELIFAFDLGGRPGLERELSLSETRFRRLLDAAPDAILILRQQQIVFANSVARSLFAGPSSTLTASELADIVHPADLKEARSAAEPAQQHGSIGRMVRLRLRRPGRRDDEVECLVQPTVWDGAPATAWVARDLSQRKRAESQRIEANRGVAVGTLSAGVAHEINNPLAYMLLNLEYLLREVPAAAGSPERFEQLHERLSDAQHGALRVGTILRELGALGRQKPAPEAQTSLGEVLDRAVRTVSPHFRGRGRVVAPTEPGPSLTVDAGRLEQLFVNLLTNAAHALPEGHGADNEVRVSITETKASVSIAVSDTGAGIAPENMGRIFDPFFSTKPPGVGTGLGLSICQSIVRSIGGHIGVESTLGKGTRFVVTLPKSQAPGTPAAAAAAPPPARLEAPKRGHVLIVDDEPSVTRVLSRALADEHDVVAHTDPRVALEQIVKDPSFDVVLCDLLMPELSGSDLYEQLRARAPGSERKLVFMTGGAFTRQASEFLERIDNQRIEKPFQIDELRQLVAKLVAER